MALRCVCVKIERDSLVHTICWDNLQNRVKVSIKQNISIVLYQIDRKMIITTQILFDYIYICIENLFSIITDLDLWLIYGERVLIQQKYTFNLVILTLAYWIILHVFSQKMILSYRNDTPLWHREDTTYSLWNDA